MNSRLLTLGLVGFVTLVVPVPDGADAPAVEFGRLLQPTIGLRVAEVTGGRRNSEITVGATVISDAGDVAAVPATVTGTVEHLRVDGTQSTVRQGEALADLYVRDWFAPQAAYLVVRNLECPGAADLVEAAGRRLRRVGMPDELIRVLERTGRPQSHVTLTAPISGVVTDLAAYEGMKVTSGSVLFRISGWDLSKVWVSAELPESLGQEVHAGDTVTARTATVPDAVFSGTVATVLPSGQHGKRAAIANVALANPKLELLPGMLVTLRFASAAGADVLFVPSEAVIAMGDRRLVALFESDGRVRPVNVELGSQGGGQTEIRSGLTLGQRVIVFDT